MFLACKKTAIENSIIQNTDNYRTTKETIQDIIENSRLAGLELNNTRHNDSMSDRDFELTQLGYNEMCDSFNQTYLVTEVYPNVDKYLEYHYTNSFDGGYYSSIYIPNLKSMNSNLTPIYCSSYGLSSAYGENSICGFYIDHGDTTTVLLDYKEILETTRPVLVYDVVLKAGVSVCLDDTIPVIDSSARTEDAETVVNGHYFFSRINIAYRYENDNTSEVRATYRPTENSVNWDQIENGNVKDIPSTGMNTLYQIWQPIYNFHLAPGAITLNFYSNYNNELFGATFEYDNLSSRKPIFVLSPLIIGGVVTVFGRMKEYNQYYQAFGFDMDNVPDGWYIQNLGSNLNWIHHYNN